MAAPSPWAPGCKRARPQKETCGPDACARRGGDPHSATAQHRRAHRRPAASSVPSAPSGRPPSGLDVGLEGGALWPHTVRDWHTERGRPLSKAQRPHLEPRGLGQAGRAPLGAPGPSLPLPGPQRSHPRADTAGLARRPQPRPRSQAGPKASPAPGPGFCTRWAGPGRREHRSAGPGVRPLPTVPGTFLLALGLAQLLAPCAMSPRPPTAVPRTGMASGQDMDSQDAFGTHSP